MVVSDTDGCPPPHSPSVQRFGLPSCTRGSLDNRKAPARLKRWPYNAQISINLHYLLAFYSHVSSVILVLSFKLLWSTVSLNGCETSTGVTWVMKGWALGFGKQEYSLSRSYVTLGQTGYHNYYPFSTGCGLHGTEHNPTVFHARLHIKEDNVYCYSPLLDVFCICWLSQWGRSGCKIYLGQSYYVSTLVPCLSSLGVQSVLTPFVSIQ